jgi:anthranilate synthase component II
VAKILVFDNYDSFTYNLVHLVEKILHQKVEVHRNDQLPLEKVKEYDKIILSPGPGIPEEAGMLLPLIKEYASSKSILGVCLGHQAIGEAFGGKLINLSTVYHGVATPVTINRKALNGKAASVSRDLFKGLPDILEVGRYHSWIVADENLPAELEVTARDENDYVQGVQFHPESVLTPKGEDILRNWLGA